MNSSNRVDVVMADDPTLSAAESKAAVATGRIIVLAANKTDGRDAASALGIDPVAIVTPRSLDAAHGVEADLIVEADGLTDEMRETLLPHATPSLATTPEV